MSPWVERSIKDLCLAIVDCINKTAPSQQCPPTPYKMLRTTNIRGGWVDTANVKYVDAATYAKWTRRMVPQRGDIILTREAPFGHVGMLRSDDQVFLGQRLVLYRADETLCDPHFLMYSMMGPVIQAELKSLGSGSTVEHLRVPDCQKLTVPLPSLLEQRKIGAILRSLDDLIENNRRRVEVLEEMASAIYREWFVKFRYPGHEDVPLVDSALGPIPVGWDLSTCGDELRFIGGGTPSKKEPSYWEGGSLAWYTPSDLTKTRWRYAAEPKLKITEAGVAKSSARVFPAGSVMMTSRATLGVLAVATTEATTNQGFIVILPDRRWTCGFIYEWLDANAAELATLGTGATFKEITKGAFKRFPFIVPAQDVLNAYRATTEPLEKQIYKLEHQTRYLAELRDLLLPKMVTGQIDVSTLNLDTLASTVSVDDEEVA